MALFRKTLCDKKSICTVCINVPAMGRGALLFPRAGVGFRPALVHFFCRPLLNDEQLKGFSKGSFCYLRERSPPGSKSREPSDSTVFSILPPYRGAKTTLIGLNGT